MKRYSDEQAAEYHAAGVWQDQVLYDIIAEHARQHGDRVFVTDGETKATYAQVREQAVRLAAGLRARGVVHGDKVAVQMPNWPEFAVITIALSRLGAVLVPIMPIFRDDEVGYILNHVGARIVIGPDQFRGFEYAAMFARIAEDAPELRGVVAVRGGVDAPGTPFAELLLEGDVDALDASLGPTASPDEVCLIVYTSGTTSRPKGCVHTFDTVYASARAMIDRLHVTEDDVFFNPSPVAHSTGLVTGLLMPILAGASTHFMPVWDPEDGLRRIAEFRCSVVYTATTFLSTLMAGYDESRHDMSSMRFWVCAGAPIPGSVIERARGLFPTLTVLSLYGRSENMTTTMCAPEDSAERAVTSDGRALEDAEVRVVDLEGREVPRGEVGDVAYRGPAHMLEYYRDPEETAMLAAADGFSRSGDLGHMDADGFVRISGRLKDIIIRGGLNISSREIEDLLLMHTAVKDVAAVAMPDQRLGEKTCVFVVLQAGQPEPTLDDLTAYLRERQIAVQKLPERLEFIEALPMTPVGKVRKNVLRDLIAAKLEREQLATVE